MSTPASSVDPQPYRCRAIFRNSNQRCDARPRGHAVCGRHEQAVAAATLATIDAPCLTCGQAWAAHEAGEPKGMCVYVPVVVRPGEPRPFTGTRESLHARIADVLRRSGVEDAESLIRAMECESAEVLGCVERARGYVAIHAGQPLDGTVGTDLLQRIDRALTGREIGPAK